ncbi:uncharacterized protein TNCV_173081 [Trichonephila clavipes]|nr:uncharacterized protein TNCV_173081 [Trichonephila clavipes]
MTPGLAPPLLLTTTPHHREDVSALDRFNVHRCPTRRVFSGTGLEHVTRQATVRYLYHSATVATTRWVIRGTGLELLTRPATIRYLDDSATAASELSLLNLRAAWCGDIPSC